MIALCALRSSDDEFESLVNLMVGLILWNEI